MYFKCGTDSRARYISISSVVERHGSTTCRCLPRLHGFTGCDTVSAFSGKGKLTALKLAKANPVFKESFQQLGMKWHLSDELYKNLEEFTCAMYSLVPGTKNVNILRYRLFCATGKES